MKKTFYGIRHIASGNLLSVTHTDPKEVETGIGMHTEDGYWKLTCTAFGLIWMTDQKHYAFAAMSNTTGNGFQWEHPKQEDFKPSELEIVEIEMEVK